MDFGAETGVESEALMLQWFDYWLKDGDRAVVDAAPVRLFVMGENRWRDEEAWPLARAVDTPWFLGGGGRADTLNGDGVLHTSPPPATSPADRYDHDRPSRSTGTAATRARQRISGAIEGETMSSSIPADRSPLMSK
ncbi:MAG: CocE/NonD family hydrolase [Vicinamibacterales bacterium]